MIILQWCRNYRGQISHGLYTFWPSKPLWKFLKCKHCNCSSAVANAQCLNQLLPHTYIVSCCFIYQLYWHGFSLTFSHLLISYGLCTMKLPPMPLFYGHYAPIATLYGKYKWYVSQQIPLLLWWITWQW